jgi:FO synthase
MTIKLIEALVQNDPMPADAICAVAECANLPALRSAAFELRRRYWGAATTYSPKVFIPLTHLCRDVCAYCTFAERPSKSDSKVYMSAEEVLSVARDGVRAGCHEALFTLGDRPEARYRTAREELTRLGHDSTLSYLAAMARLVFEETGLLPHLNYGVASRSEMLALRQVSVSQGLMLESSSERLCEKGGPHFGSPDKHPSIRLRHLADAGEAGIPMTSGLLIGIGETRLERVETLLALRELHLKYGHIQEVIVQNFRAKEGTRMSRWPEPSLDDLVWTIAVARLILPGNVSIQTPPNLSPGALGDLLWAGINDWGGISPVTKDYVNPEAPWPAVASLTEAGTEFGLNLVPRLPVYPRYIREQDRWLDAKLQAQVLAEADAEGFARVDAWVAGANGPIPPGEASLVRSHARRTGSSAVTPILVRARQGKVLSEADIVALFAARGAEFSEVCQAADEIRQDVNGDAVSYVVTRNINYTNICHYHCQFCAFSKGKLSENLRGRPYDIDDGEICRRSKEAWARGATEVCMQGGIHPEYTGQRYLDICRAVKSAVPDLHVHAFSPLEVSQGAETLGLSVREFLIALHEAGLGTLPGTAAEVLDDEVRRSICPDKLTAQQWLDVIETAHEVGFKTTSTIMFGHVDTPVHWARHLLSIRRLQERTGGFTEFIPLPFVHMETPIFLKGRARRGPTFREAILMHAIGRIALHPVIRNIQCSWVKLGQEGIRLCLSAGVNDLGGTLMDETITRSAGAVHGQELSAERIEEIILSEGRIPLQRTTTYQRAAEERRRASFNASPILPKVEMLAKRSNGRQTVSAEL